MVVHTPGCAGENTVAAALSALRCIRQLVRVADRNRDDALGIRQTGLRVRTLFHAALLKPGCEALIQVIDQFSLIFDEWLSMREADFIYTDAVCVINHFLFEFMTIHKNPPSIEIYP